MMDGIQLSEVVVRLTLAIFLLSTGLHRVFRVGIGRQARHYLPLFLPAFARFPRLGYAIFWGLLALASGIEIGAGILLVINLFPELVAGILAIYFLMYAGLWAWVSPWWDVRHYFFRFFLYLLYLWLHPDLRIPVEL